MRPADRLDASVRMVEERGMEAMTAPSLEVLPGDVEALAMFMDALSDEGFDDIVFTSATGVRVVSALLGDLGSRFEGSRVIAIGPGTCKELERSGVDCETMPRDFTSKGLLDMMRPSANGSRVAILRSDHGERTLREGLEAAGADVLEVAVYRLRHLGGTPEMVAVVEAAAAGDVDALLFTSALSVRGFMETAIDTLGDSCHGRLGRVTKVAIGPPTARALESFGVVADVVAEEATFASMLDALEGLKAQ